MAERARSARRARVVLTAVALLTAARSEAVTVKMPFPVSLRARLDMRATADEAATPSGNLASRTTLDFSRFMLDVTTGGTHSGTFYLKSAASWRDTDDAAGRVRFRVEQGDWRHAWSSRHSRIDLCAFGDERRFFTGELATEVMHNDAVERFQHRVGARADAGYRAGRASLLVSTLDEGAASRTLVFGAAGAATMPAFASVSVLHQDPQTGASNSIAKAEAGVHYWRLTLVASYAHAGVQTRAIPSGRWGDFEFGHYADAAPANSATFAEVRTARGALGANVLVGGAYRYSLYGAQWVDDLAPHAPGESDHAVWVDCAHRHLALDVRARFRDRKRFQFLDTGARTAELGARAILRDNSELFARAGIARKRGTLDEGTRGFVEGSYGRGLQRFAGAVHARVDELGDEALVGAGAEARVNWNATSAVTLRWLVNDVAERAQSVFARLEFRPTRRTWLTFAYGREHVGAGAYFFEDVEAVPAPSTNDVFSIVVRGDL